MHSYTKEQFLEAVKTSTSKRQVMLKLGLAGKGGNYNVFNRLAKQHNPDMSHFTGQSWSKGKQCSPKQSIEIYLSNKKPIQSYQLKNRLLKEKFFTHQCNMCGSTNWLNNPIPLELHHIDGDSDNNNLSNLQLLCPNCHALTNNYRAKNK